MKSYSTSAVSGAFSSSFSRGRGRGRGRDSSHDGCGFRPRGHMSRGGCHSRGRVFKLCTHCGGTNHTVEYCYDLHGFPQAHRVTPFKDVRQVTHSTAMVTISVE